MANTETDSSGSTTNPTVRSLLRFWWLVLAGLILGAIAGFLVLQAKTHKKYQATAKLFVDAPSAPYLRTIQTQVTRSTPRTRVVRVPGKNGKLGGTRLQTLPAAPTVVSSAPDTDTLVNDANFYPLVIQSDAVQEIRTTNSGPAPAGCQKIQALADKASTNTFGVFKPSPVPVVDVLATCKDREDSKDLATNTVNAFNSWVFAHQREARVPRGQRVKLTVLTAAGDTKTIGGPSAGLPVFIGVVVFLLFCGLAILLDRPRPAHVAAETPQPADSSA
jgi:hypothetical protein